MASDKVASFGINVKATTDADIAAMSVEELSKAIKGSKEAVASYGSSLAKLRGNSDEVKDASAKLKAAKESERDAISRATLALGKQGLTIADVARAEKSAAAEAKKASEVQKKAADDAKAAADKTKDAWKNAALGVVAAVAAIAVGITAAAVSFAKFIFESSDALRTMGLFREAATGSEANAKAFGHQIEALAEKIPTSREELNKLSVEMSRSLVSTRVSGQGIIDTFNAVAQTSAAMGDSAGKALQSIVERGKNLGRIGIGLNELQGTGIEFTDVAKALASNLKIGIDQAQMQLRMGTVRVDAGAKALRQVVEKRFGAINSKMMLSLPNLAKKFRDNLVALTSDVDLSPILEGLSKFGDLFSRNTVAGATLKKIFTDFGNIAGKIFKTVGPIAEVFFKQMIIETLKLEVTFLKAKIWFDKTFGKDFVTKLDLGGAAVTAVKGAFALLTAGVAITVAGVVALTVAFAKIMHAGQAVADFFGDFWTAITAPGKNLGEEFSKIGGYMVDGLIAGIQGAASRIGSAVSGVAEDVKSAFKNALGIHSPSVVFEGYGKMTGAGFSEGVDASAPKANQSVERMVTPPSIPALGGRGGGAKAAPGGPVSVTLEINFPNAKSGGEVQAALTDGDFKQKLLRVFEEIARGSGAPTQGAT